MTTTVDKSIKVDVPVSTAYNQWTQFEEFPQFMGGIKKVEQLDDKRLHWVAEIGGVKREWEATILEQVPDTKVAWAAIEGATNAGAVEFEPLGLGQTMVRLHLEYEPEGLVEQVGDKLNIIEKRAEADLEKFKEFIESQGGATGAWRGQVNEGIDVGTPDIESAALTRGDDGKAGLSAKTVVTGAAVAAGAALAANALSGKSGSSEEGPSGSVASSGTSSSSSSGTGGLSSSSSSSLGTSDQSSTTFESSNTSSTGDGLTVAPAYAAEGEFRTEDGLTKNPLPEGTTTYESSPDRKF